MAAAKKATGKARKSAAKKTTRGKAGGSKAAPKKAARKATAKKKTTPRKRSGPVSRLQQELPATLGEFSKGVRRQLNALERNIEKSDWRYRRQTTRALRDASHLLGRLEADGDRAWKRLTAQARREVLGVLRSVERAVEGPNPPGRKETRRSPAKTASRARRRSTESSGSGI
jgi:hypothetical protein